MANFLLVSERNNAIARSSVCRLSVWRL